MLSNTVLRELANSHGWTTEFAAQVYPYYVATLRNLALGRPTAVFRIVDDMWHAHILCTREYAEFCRQEFGRFVHHERLEQDDTKTAEATPEFFREYGLELASLRGICAERPEYLSAPTPETFSSAGCTSPFGPPSFAQATCGAPGPGASPSGGPSLTQATCVDAEPLKPPSAARSRPTGTG